MQPAWLSSVLGLLGSGGMRNGSLSKEANTLVYVLDRPLSFTSPHSHSGEQLSPRNKNKFSDLHIFFPLLFY